MDIATKRKKTTKVLLAGIGKLDSYATGANVARYEKMLSQMTDKEFDKYMKAIRDKETVLYVYMPNMTKRPLVKDLLVIAGEMGVKLFHRIKKYDSVTKRHYVTNEAYPVIRIPVRRLQQFQYKKMSVPHGSSKVDSMTGQVAWEDKSASLSNPEIQAMDAKGLTKTLEEFIAIRGGNIEAWSGEMRRQGEETGEIILDDISGGTHTRTVEVAKIFFDCMMLDNNFVDE